jgi:hypothetical protein
MPESKNRIAGSPAPADGYAAPSPSPRSCAAEISIPGIIYVRLERCPRWLPHAALTAAGVMAGWLAARYPGLLPR